ncbi:MAG: PAS domain-containing protein, partial [Candidatus Marinimicrobia bacterium]|nr:PAS domain-containing protein [Candidatus Neomarinimicrobiota bacterium]
MKQTAKQIMNILLVEDNPMDARLAQEILKRSQLYQCKTTLVDSMAGAEKQLAKKLPDTILLDLGLPDSEGMATYSKIKDVAPRVPVVILSASGDQESARAAIRNGAKDYLIKSVESYQYLERAIRFAVEAGRIEKLVFEGTEKLQEVSEAAVALADIGLDEDIYAIIAKSMKSLSGAMITHISIVKENKLLSIQYIDGLPGILKKASSLLGVPLEGVEFEMDDDIFTDLFSGKSHITDNLSKAIFISFLSPGKLSKIQRLLGIGEILFLPLRYKNTLVGICSVVYNKNIGLGTHLIQLLKVFTDAAAIALHQREARRQLAKSEARLAEAQRIAHVGNWNWNIVEGGDYWSDEIYRIFGHQPQEYKATFDKFMDIVHPDDRDPVTLSVDQAMKGKPYSLEHRIVLPDGQVRTLHGRGEVAFDSHGKPIRMVGTLQDITERKQASERLEFAAAELDQFIKSTHSLVFGVDKQGKINEWNKAAEIKTGLTKDDVMGRDIKGMRSIPDDSKALVQNMIKRGLKGKETTNVEFSLHHQDGQLIRLLLSATTRRDIDGNIVGVLGIGQDITELDKYRASLEQMVEEKHDFPAEIRTPLVKRALELGIRQMGVSQKYGGAEIGALGQVLASE